ncbi:ClpP/crotonase-like domain-containing protein [Pavlovales sp. CCMP2436]|nr:ClpP/crotonase-like domain-containing protein [Pavlovales sp. CCMP2436]
MGAPASGGHGETGARGVTDAKYTPYKQHEFRDMGARTTPAIEAWAKHRENAHLTFKPGKHIWGGLIFGIVIPVILYNLIKADMRVIDDKEGRQRPFITSGQGPSGAGSWQDVTRLGDAWLPPAPSRQIVSYRSAEPKMAARMAAARAVRAFAASTPAALGRRAFSTGDPVLKVEQLNGVRTLIYNDPRRLNAWTAKLMHCLRDELTQSAADAEVKAVALTGTDPYYCAGVDLGAMVSKPMWPSALHTLLVAQNTALFAMFLDFPKPLFVGVNGPAIGAAVTSATLGEGVVASEKATFHTPFHALGLVPEGCSSVNFARIMGEQNAQRMLGAEGWKPTAKEAAKAGLVDKAVAHDELRAELQAMAEAWVAAKKPKRLVAAGLLEEYKRVNARESKALADAFLSPSFFEAQAAMATKKGKASRAAMFTAMKLLRPIWGMSLPPK